MNVATIDNLQIIKESVRDFAERVIRPKVMEWDEAQHFPVDVMHQLGEQGFLGVLVPEMYGG
ncbi:MAG: acyl-CoA dehydrogenase family protein, partial [Bacteroidota bacterium]